MILATVIKNNGIINILNVVIIICALIIIGLGVTIITKNKK